MLKYHIIFKNGKWCSQEYTKSSIHKVSMLQHAINSACFAVSQNETDIVSILIQDFD